MAPTVPDCDDVNADHSRPPVRAPFRRGRPTFGAEAEHLLKDVLLDVAIPLPIPHGRGPRDDAGTGLPARFVIEVRDAEVCVLGEGGGETVERWPRGAVTAYVRTMDESEVELVLRWPGGERAGRILADATAQARAVAELLSADTRVQGGADRAGDEQLRRLVRETLSEPVRIERQAAVGVLAQALQHGERPLLAAAADRGMGYGLLLLTDRRLLWGSIGRRDPLVLAREEITAARCETLVRDYTTLAIERTTGRRVVLDAINPAQAGEAIAATLTAARPAPDLPDGLDALVTADPDEAAATLIGRQLERVRALLLDGERPEAFACALRGSRLGALVVTDRRVLWAGRKAAPIVIERGDVRATRVTPRRIATSLEIEIECGDDVRFDAVEPAARAALIVAALAPPAP